jgi:polysaccharide export outer membrane protein
MNRTWIRWFPVWLWLLLGAGFASAAGEDYLLGPGDLLKVNVYGYDDLTAEVRISQTGFINYPLLGEVSISGISPREAGVKIASKLIAGGFIREPKVDVLVLEYQSQKISVMGQVNKPGKYALTTASTVLDMLAEAGGLVNALAGDQASLLRKNGSKVMIDLHALFEGDLTQNYAVGGGDTIFIPKAPQFYVYGEVQRPGMYRLERGMTVSQAITTGGGLTPRGTERRAVVKRKQADGTQTEVKVETTSQLEPDDVLFIKESWF